LCDIQQLDTPVKVDHLALNPPHNPNRDQQLLLEH
jgi:hypothetical protein